MGDGEYSGILHHLWRGCVTALPIVEGKRRAKTAKPVHLRLTDLLALCLGD